MALRILVTGADGFIGSHLVERLVADGAEVRAFSLYNSFGTHGWLDSLPEAIRDAIDIVAGDIRDTGAVRTAMQGQNRVFHLAALVGIPYSYEAPESYVDTNIKGTLNVVQAAKDLDVEHIMCTSTSEVYGTAQFVPITEEHPLVGQSPYSATKIAADQLALSYQRAFGLPVSIARPFNTYGPRQSMRAVIPAIIGQIAAGARSIRLGALAPTRDFNYVADTVAGMIAIAQTPESIGEVINLGTNHEISIGDLAPLIADLMGKSIDIETDDKRLRPADSEVERLCASNEKARRILNWGPETNGREGLRQGLEKTVAWFLEPENLRHYQNLGYTV
jgi:NAD dependent epimerase/dehydratase